MIHARTRVRVGISQDRRFEAEREIVEYALGVGAGRPFRQGTDPDLIFDFAGVDQTGDAAIFAANVRNTPGVSVFGPTRLP